MNILAFDTCTDFFSVAIFSEQKGGIIYEYAHNIKNQHSELLLETIDNALDSLQLQYSSFDYIALTNGPGSFTGIRTGLAIAKGISLVTNAKIVTVGTLEAMLSACDNMQDKILAILNAGRGIEYVYKAQQPIDSVEIVESEKISQYIDSEYRIVRISDILCLASNIIKVAGSKIAKQEYTNTPEPVYIREVSAKIPKQDM